MTKIWLSMLPDQANRITGIGQVVLAQYNYLPQYGLELVSSPEQADVIACHVAKASGLPRVDVLHCHGLYWADLPHSPYSNWHNSANKEIIATARRARKITVPSEWVAYPFKRDMRLNPVVIPHGIDLGEFKPGKSRGYVLYNKNREMDVCTSKYALALARRGLEVHTTFLPRNEKDPPPNLALLGVISFEEMRSQLAEAEIYLATTIETFGIGTLEAMASGVPVLGFNWGGTADIVRHKIDGYLVAPDDTDGLMEGYEYIRQNRAAMSQAARERAAQFAWDKVMGGYADLYNSLAQDAYTPSGPSIIITNHNYGRWVGEAMRSAVVQVLPPLEVIVVDDASTDNSKEIIEKTKEDLAYAGIPIRTIYFEHNQGVAQARNAGIVAARSEMVTCLDADDRIDKLFVAHLFPAMQKDRGIGIAYGGLSLLNEQGGLSYARDWPPEFSWETQSAPAVPPSNCIPSACMFRKDMWWRAGGYKQEYAPGEDAEFWTRGLSIGYEAKRITQDSIFEYRVHAGSASRVRKYIAIDENLPWMRSKEYPMAAPAKGMVAVRSYAEPDISIIIPVGPNHAQWLPGNLDALLGQTFWSWEVIIVDDTESGEVSHVSLTAYPFAQVLHNTGPTHGAGAARNRGIERARGKFIIFLDADDYLLPTALEEMIKAFDGKNYVYTDYLALSADGKSEVHQSLEYDQYQWKMFHPITVLMPAKCVRKLMFDETLPSWEDHDFFLRAAIQGYCGKRLAKPLLVYRMDAGYRRKKAIQVTGAASEEGRAILKIFSERYGQYYQGENKMSPCSGCGGGSSAAQAILKAKGLGQTAPDVSGIPVDGNITPQRVRMEYFGPRIGAVTITVNGHQYRAGNNPIDRYLDVVPEDVNPLVAQGDYRIVAISPDLANPAPRQPVIEEVPKVAAVSPAQLARDQDLIQRFNAGILQARQAAQAQAAPQVEEKPPEKTAAQLTAEANDRLMKARAEMEQLDNDPAFDALERIQGERKYNTPVAQPPAEPKTKPFPLYPEPTQPEGEPVQTKRQHRKKGA